MIRHVPKSNCLFLLYIQTKHWHRKRFIVQCDLTIVVSCHPNWTWYEINENKTNSSVFWGGFLFIFLINVKCFVNLIAIFYEIFWFVWIFLYAHKITYWDNIETLNREYSRFFGTSSRFRNGHFSFFKVKKNARIVIEIAMFRHFSWFN